MAMLRRQDLRIVSDIHDTADPTEPPNFGILYLRSITNPIAGFQNRWMTNHYYDPTRAAVGPKEILTFLDGEIFEFLDGIPFELI